jgi:sorting nexin-3/12
MAKRLANISVSSIPIVGQGRDQEQANLCAFYMQLIRLPQVQNLHGGFLTALPSILATLQQPSLSPLPRAMSALLLTFVSEKGKEKNRRAMTEAMAFYGEALQLTRQLVEERDEQRMSELVMTIFLLGMYEVGFSSISPFGATRLIGDCSAGLHL